MIIETQRLNQTLLDALSKKTRWIDAAELFPVDDIIETFFHTRSMMQKTVTGLTDAQASYTSASTSIWSISETVTHLIYSQNFYYNSLLDITNAQGIHLAEAAQGFGEGARGNIPAELLDRSLKIATEMIRSGIELTRPNATPSRVSHNPLFGNVNYQTWLLLLLGHETDHVRQAIVMRRMARSATRETPIP